MVFVGLIRQGLDFKSPDGMNVFLVFLIMSDDRDVGLHLKTLAHIARLTVDTDLVSAARETSTADELFRLILEKEKQI
jgi:mannitol/fructose-specific phosphotransferase system IIA component (Ntr-type)